MTCGLPEHLNAYSTLALKEHSSQQPSHLVPYDVALDQESVVAETGLEDDRFVAVDVAGKVPCNHQVALHREQAVAVDAPAAGLWGGENRQGRSGWSDAGASANSARRSAGTRSR